MTVFAHYARFPEAVAAAERALAAWRREAAAERRRAGLSLQPAIRLARAERRIRDILSFLAPNPPRCSDRSSPTLPAALRRLCDIRSAPDAQSIGAALGADRKIQAAAADVARRLVLAAPGAGHEDQASRHDRLGLHPGTPEGQAALDWAIRFGEGLLP